MTTFRVTPDTIDDISPTDLRREAAAVLALPATGVAYDSATGPMTVTVFRGCSVREDWADSVRVTVLSFDGIGRYGVAAGGDAVWTDADSPEDAARRVCVTGEVAP